MAKYFLQATAFKPSGKHYNTGEPVFIKEASSYPASEVYTALEKARSNLDELCELNKGSVVANKFTVLLQVIDNTSEPVCFQALIHP